MMYIIHNEILDVLDQNFEDDFEDEHDPSWEDEIYND